MQGAARDQAVGTEGNKGSQALHLTASASYKELATVQYTEEEQRVLDAAKWEHRDTTAACRRCLQVATETNEVAIATVDALYTQGQQMERAAHGVEQIDHNVKHASRIVKYMSRFCCCRNTWNDSDLERERHYRRDEVQRQRMEGVLAAEGIAESYASKRQFAGSAAAKASAGVADADAAAAAAAKAAADVADEAAWDELIAAAPGPLGVQREQQQQGRSLLGSGLAAPDRQQLQAETAAQEAYIDQVGVAVDALKAISQAMQQEMEEQAPKLEALQQRTEDADMGLRSMAKGAAKLVGPAPHPRRRASSANPYADQDAAAAAVARAAVATAPVAAKHRSLLGA